MKKIIISLMLLLLCGYLRAQRMLTVRVDKPAATIDSTMWGIFFEDINFAADGGLYAELIKNGSFEFPMPLMGWKEIKQPGDGKLLIINQSTVQASNTRYAHITVNAENGSLGLSNEGFRGIGIHQGEQYDFSIWLNGNGANLSLRVELINEQGIKIANGSIGHIEKGWQKRTVSFKAAATAEKAKLNVYFEGTGAIDADRLSLFPHHTWKERPKGLRNDLVQLLADLQPGFLRFPGGCIVEGRDLSNRYQWKNTVGDPEERKLIMNRWNVEFSKRAAPDYYQSFGLGFYEYFLLAEDIGAAPLPIINCGMACQFNSGEVASMNEVDPYIQDALDLVEFANGDVSTKWGQLRAAMGHPLPFHLSLIGIGNEQWDEQYIERYKVFEKTFRQKYPGIQLVAAAGPSPAGPRFEYAWNEFRKLSPAFIDEHYYQNPDWFFSHANRYDQYERKGPKIFAGEYAAHQKEEIQPESRNTWLSALAEAAFMTGLERNADIVKMSSYAPLLAHVDAWQWRPDLIWFDNLHTVATPNYYVQQLFSVNRGTRVIPLLQNGQPLTGKDSLYGSAVLDEKNKQVVIKLVNAGEHPEKFEISLEGIKSVLPEVMIEEMYNNDLDIYNSIDQPRKIIPEKRKIQANRKLVAITVQARSFSVIKMGYNK